MRANGVRITALRAKVPAAIAAERIGHFVRHWQAGRRHGYPVCCVFQFAATRAFYPDGHDQRVRRGRLLLCVRPNGSRAWYVPCSAHARRDAE